jgi:anti-sigma-K factor RskA
MPDDDQDALAAEYVLGTLSADERDQAEALIGVDSGFAEVVHRWERRLGELHVMVEAVEPPPELWEKLKTQISAVAASGTDELPRAAEAAPVAPGTPSPTAALATSLTSPAAKLASILLPLDDKPETGAPAAAASDLSAELLSPAAGPRPIERSADVIYLAGRLTRWRRLTVAVGALAALLALYIGLWQFAPDLIPPQLQPSAAGIMARSEAPGRLQQDRLVAVLQHDPTAPAFLLTLDTQRRMLTVRRVSATAEAGRSYELWLISSRYSGPRSLGIVGKDEFTQRAVPVNYDVDTLKAASYAVSLEPAGGSPSGAPTGPILFTGKAVESLPGSAPPT